jgi:hypothetical protein
VLHLQNHPALCAHYSNRAENHGGEAVPAGDLSLTFNMESRKLEEFETGLQAAFFRQPHGGEQPQLIGDGFTAVRFPRLKPIELAEEFPGYRLELGGELELDEPLVLIDVNLKGFVFEPLEGGSVKVSCKAQVHPSDEAEAGALCFSVKKSVSLTLIPPARDTSEPSQQPDLLADADKPADALQQAAAALEHAE